MVIIHPTANGPLKCIIHIGFAKSDMEARMDQCGMGKQPSPSNTPATQAKSTGEII